jgi:lysine-arginine-ornithine-binding protein
MKKVILGVALVLAAFGVNAKEMTELRFGVDPSYAPFESKAPSGQLVGFEIDIGNEICKRLEVKCVWVENAFDGMIPALKARKFDAILSAMSITPQREEQVAFSQRLFNTPTRLIAKDGSELKPTLASLRGKSVGVAQGSTQEAYTKAYWSPAGINVVSYTDQEQVYPDLRAGRVDATLTDMIAGDQGFLKTAQGKGYSFVGDPVNDAKTLGKGAAIGFRKEDAALRQKVDQAIGTMLKDGTYKKIEQRYFHFDIFGG